MNIISSVNNVSNYLKLNSPKIFVVSSMVLGASACVASSVATWNTRDVLEEHNEDINELHWQLKEAKDAEEETKIKKDIWKRYGKTVAIIGANYAPAVGLLAGSVYCGSKGIISYEKNIAIVGAGALALKQMYDNAKLKVEEKYGAEEAADIFYGVEGEKEVKKVNEDGTVEVKKVKQYDPYGIVESNPCSILLGEGIGSNLTGNMWYDISFIQSLEKKYTFKLNSEGYVLIQDIYKDIGVKPGSRYQHDLWAQYGWIKDQNKIDDYIRKCHEEGIEITDDGILKANSVTLGLNNIVNEDYISGFEPVFWLIPNCIGDIMPFLYPDSQINKLNESLIS